MQISAYITHKNLAVRKILQAMRTMYAKINTSQTIHEANDHTTVYFAESLEDPGGKGAFEVRHSFLYFFSLVRISEFSYANFSSTCVQCMHLLKS